MFPTIFRARSDPYRTCHSDGQTGRRRIRSTCVQILVTLSVISVVGACSPDPEGNGGEPSLGPRIEPGDMRGFTLPLDSYVSAPVVEILEAENVLVHNCMADFGFTGEYLNIDSPETHPPPNHHRYWLVSNSDATALGYLSPWAGAAKEKLASNIDWSQVEVTLLLGREARFYEGREIPEGGCLGEARRKLAQGAPKIPEMEGAPIVEDGSGTSVAMIADHLADESFDHMIEDSRVKDAVAQWRTCMAGQGLEYESPREANNDPKWYGDVPSAEEIETAKADVACKEQVDLVSTMATVETAYQHRALETNADALAKVREAIDTRLENARSVLAGR